MKYIKSGIVKFLYSFEGPKIFGIVAFLVIIAIIPLTVYLAEAQQDLRQRAQENGVAPKEKQTCPDNSLPGFYCQAGGCDSGDTDLKNDYICSNNESCCYIRNPMITKVLTPSVTPTPTGDPGTFLDLELKLMAIGKNGSKSENNDPQNKTQQALVEIFKSTKIDPVSTETANIIYSSSSGTFKGTINLDNAIDQTGNYSFEVKTGKYLSKIIGNDVNRVIQHIVKGTRKAAPLTTLVVGDVNSDNILNIQDWHIWNACRNKTVTTPVPLDGISANCGITDLNDDGEVDSNRGTKINMEDYKWLFNSFQIQAGD